MDYLYGYMRDRNTYEINISEVFPYIHIRKEFIFNIEELCDLYKMLASIRSKYPSNIDTERGIG